MNMLGLKTLLVSYLLIFGSGGEVLQVTGEEEACSTSNGDSDIEDGISMVKAFLREELKKYKGHITIETGINGIVVPASELVKTSEDVVSTINNDVTDTKDDTTTPAVDLTSTQSNDAHGSTDSVKCITGNDTTESKLTSRPSIGAATTTPRSGPPSVDYSETPLSPLADTTANPHEILPFSTHEGTSTVVYDTTRSDDGNTGSVTSAAVSSSGQPSPTPDSTSAAMTSPVSTGASSQTTIASSTAETITKGSCDITFNGMCYWSHAEDRWKVDFARAEEIFSSKASTPAHFPNENVYNNVVEDVRSKIPSGWSWVYVWTGVTIDTNTGNLIHPSGDTYVKWYPGYPLTGSSYKARSRYPGYPLTGSPYKTLTHVALLVGSDPGYINQGMFNYSPQWGLCCVVCQLV